MGFFSKLIGRNRRQKITIEVAADDPNVDNPSEEDAQTGMALFAFIDALQQKDKELLGRAMMETATCPHCSYVFRVGDSWDLQTRSFSCPRCKKLMLAFRHS